MLLLRVSCHMVCLTIYAMLIHNICLFYMLECIFHVGDDLKHNISYSLAYCTSIHVHQHLLCMCTVLCVRIHIYMYIIILLYDCAFKKDPHIHISTTHISLSFFCSLHALFWHRFIVLSTLLFSVAVKYTTYTYTHILQPSLITS